MPLNKWTGGCLGAALILSATASAGHETFEGYRVVHVVVNGKEVRGDVPAIEFHGRTFLPIRAIAESLGAQVEWDGATWTAMISAPDVPALQAEREKLASDLAAVQAELAKLKRSSGGASGTSTAKLIEGKATMLEQPWDTKPGLHLHKRSGEPVTDVLMTADGSFKIGSLPPGDYVLYGINRAMWYGSKGEPQEAGIGVGFTVKDDGSTDHPLDVPLFVEPPMLTLSASRVKVGESVAVSLSWPNGGIGIRFPGYLVFTVGKGTFEPSAPNVMLGEGGTLKAVYGRLENVQYRGKGRIVWQATSDKRVEYPVTAGIGTEFSYTAHRAEVGRLTPSAPGQIRLIVTDPTGNAILHEVTLNVQ